ncbi:hypothetical protein MUA02_09470 [Enterobacteriaceae bacterium H20N1]|uniref:Uncharacterized protein n=1 Tax=Dryocola boscaweniae TaxID=2925397 RepID=A0A9X2W8U5_9ENTR|nr:hypothetical protein [Dryocola boscaweniae]MCT4702283.1 hypothetical protein [Dryocola boscaweniae]MCT4713858.1 hypothetical protein [Dryocola boscaweniae]MCT4719273.1 hypothetical protein [Dryocola boscaweniae]
MATYFENYHGWLQDARAVENQKAAAPVNGVDSLEPYPTFKAHLRGGINAGAFSPLWTVTKGEMQP